MNKKMKSVALCTLSATMVLGFATTASAATATLSATNLQVDGNDVAVQAYMIDANNYIKLRDMAAMINGTENNFAVTWNGELGSIELQSGTAYTTTGTEMAMDGDQTTSATLSTSPIYVDGDLVDLTAYNIGGNNYFKLRDVMGLFDVAIGYDNATNTAILTTGGTSETVVEDVEEVIVEEEIVEEVEEVVAKSAAYTYPDVKKPSSTMTLSWEYFGEVFSYLAVSGEDSFTFTATGYTYDELITDADYIAAFKDGYDYALGQHIDILKLYFGYAWNYTSGNNTKMTLYLTCDNSIYKDLDAVEDARDDFFDEVADLVNGFYASGAINASDSDTVKARYIYNWVCDNTNYGFNTSNPYSGYTTLQTGEGICMGYAGLLNAMLRTAGIECYGVGCSANGEGHTINMAKLDDSWVYIDATFGDTGTSYDKYFAMNKDTVNQIYVLDHKWA